VIARLTELSSRRRLSSGVCDNSHHCPLPELDMATERPRGAHRSRGRAAKRARREKILIKSAWGSDDPTKASFAFLHANAFADAGHEVQIFLLGEAVSIMRGAVADAVVPVGWPPLGTTLRATIAHGIRIHV
jgi:hypothetical protein